MIEDDKGPLDPRPMTPEQIADLVERTRANTVEARKVGGHMGQGIMRRRRVAK